MSGSGRVGFIVVGMGGVGSSLIAGILAARGHLVHPDGSLVEAGALRPQIPLTELNDLEIGAFELRDDDAHRAAVRAGFISRSLLDELRPDLRRIRAMQGARQAPTRRHLADALSEDMRGFLAHHHCSRGVVVCTLPGVRSAPPKMGFSSDEVWKALEQSADWVTPGVVYAAAAAQAGCGFVAVGRDAALGAPGIPEMFAERNLPIAGAGLLGPDALLRETVAQVLAAEAMSMSGAASLSTRAEERGARLWGGPDRTSEMALGCSWAGGAFEVSIELRGQVALYLAGRSLDAALFVELAGRAGRSGAQLWMDPLFATPLGSTIPRAAAQGTLLERRAAMMAELSVLASVASREAA
ncbi:MAG TPA: inositol-3-phosphate synthase [Myxococcales bacterium]